MTTILVIFALSLALSLVLTPLAGRFGTRFGALDLPDERKVHLKPLPRTGGLAIFFAFILTVVMSTFFRTAVSELFVWDKQTAFLLAGAAIVWGLGVFDDFHRVGPKIKLLFQVIAGSFAFWGGIEIEAFHPSGAGLGLAFVGYFLTIVWFLVFINAINLMDGLDGLAGGVVFFVCIVMVILSTLNGAFLTGALFAAMAGSTLGFLRYNFNPASVFLGDGGSYFLGYAVAALSIMGSVKAQVGAAILIPILALGVPLFDTALSTVRRFLRGRRIFLADRGHIHHKLLEMGFSSRKVVWIIYSVSVFLCLSAVLIVNFRDEKAGLFLIVLGAGAVLFVRKLGYLEYFASEKIIGWFKDLTDQAGLTQNRRTFLSLQIDADNSRGIEELWQHITHALEMLEFDKGALYLNNFISSKESKRELAYPGDENGCDRRQVHVNEASVCMRKMPPEWYWQSRELAENGHSFSHSLLRFELPLVGKGDTNHGTLMLFKDMRLNGLRRYSLRRLESLRKTIICTLEKLEVGAGRGQG